MKGRPGVEPVVLWGEGIFQFFIEMKSFCSPRLAAGRCLKTTADFSLNSRIQGFFRSILIRQQQPLFRRPSPIDQEAGSGHHGHPSMRAVLQLSDGSKGVCINGMN
jgi:hypothetical protein